MRRHALRKSPLTPLFPPGQRPYGPEAKEGEFLPFVKGGKEGFSLPCLYNYGLTNNTNAETILTFGSIPPHPALSPVGRGKG